MESLSKTSTGFKDFIDQIGSWVTVKQYLFVHLIIETIKDFEGKFRQLNSCKKENLSSFNREDSPFWRNQRPDEKDIGSYFDKKQNLC